MQQLSQECLGWGLEVQAFSRGIVVGGDEGIEGFGTDGEEIGLARQWPAHASDGVLDTPFCQGLWVSQKKVWIPRSALRR